MKHYNIAIFVPHNGCPHQCSFCSQNQITGQSTQPGPEDVAQALETARKSLKTETVNAEIAFFGGSFTAIPREYMLSLLEAASPAVKSGEFGGIRLSTRPDAIDCKRLELLRDHGVTAIELGAQSMDDEVLRLNERGHSAEDVAKASALIHEYGFSLGLQMMTGLYGSNEQKDIMTARRLAELLPDTVRIYPTVVMKNTRLAQLFENGEYFPPDTAQSVGLCARLLKFFEEKGINVIRLGLHDSDSLRESMIAGAFHPAFRELCESRIMRDNTQQLLENNGINGGEVSIEVNSRSISRFCGQKKENIRYFEAKGISIKLKRDDSLGKYEVRISDKVV